MTVNQMMILLCLLLGALCSKGNQPVYTQVTCLYDIKRGEIDKVYKRGYDDYLRYFSQLLQTNSNFIIYGGIDLQEFVWKHRKHHNTVFIVKELASFKDMWFDPYVQKLRKEIPQRPNFRLKEHPAFKLQYYNLLMFGKLFLLEQAMKYDKFNSDFFIWTDGGLTHVFRDNKTMMYPEDHLIKWFTFFQPQWLFLTTTFDMRHQGFTQGSVRYVGVNVQEVVLGGFFGGYIEAVRDVKCTFQNFLRIMLQNGDMNSDETAYSMLPVKFPFLFPITTSCWFDYLYKKLHIYMNSNRKQEHHRNFRPTFYSQNSLIGIEPKDGQLPAQRFQELIENQKRWQRQSNQLSELVRGNSDLIKQIFLREAFYLLLLIILFAAVKMKTREIKEANNIREARQEYEKPIPNIV